VEVATTPCYDLKELTRRDERGVFYASTLHHPLRSDLGTFSPPITRVYMVFMINVPIPSDPSFIVTEEAGRGREGCYPDSLPTPEFLSLQ
jgi:hypothetical protein